MSKTDISYGDSVFQIELKPKSKKKVVCYECNTPGHKIPDCLFKKNQRNNNVNKDVTSFTTDLNTSGFSNKDLWYVASGYVETHDL